MIYTVWVDYYATGEGRTIFAWMGHARSSNDARFELARKIGAHSKYFMVGAEHAEGITKNEVTELAFSPAVFLMVGMPCDFELFSHIHLNFA